MFIRFDATHKCDRHTQTPHDDVALRGKNYLQKLTIYNHS